MKSLLVLFTIIFITACSGDTKPLEEMPEGDRAPGQGAWLEYCEREKDSELCKTP